MHGWEMKWIGLDWEWRGGKLIWVVRNEAKGDVTACVDFDRVATDRRRWRGTRWPTVSTGVGWGAIHDLEVVAVEMDRMATSVKIVDYDFDRVVIV